MYERSSDKKRSALGHPVCTAVTEALALAACHEAEPAAFASTAIGLAPEEAGSMWAYEAMVRP